MEQQLWEVELPYRPDVTGNKPSVPNGMHQAKAAAIAIFITFSLAFLRFWAFQGAGWTAASVAIALIVVASLVLQVVALLRGLRVEDDDPQVYRRTIQVFTASVWLLAPALLIAGNGLIQPNSCFGFAPTHEEACLRTWLPGAFLSPNK